MYNKKHPLRLQLSYSNFRKVMLHKKRVLSHPLHIA